MGVAGLRQLILEHSQHFCYGGSCVLGPCYGLALPVTAGVQGLQTDWRAAENRKNSCESTARPKAGVLAFHPLSEYPK